MRSLLLTLALALVCGTAIAGGTYRFSKGVVVEGDNVAALIKRAGQPTRVVQLENRFGGAEGERWEYYIGTTVVSFTIENSKIVSIEESR